MDHDTHTHADPAELAHAQAFWASFTHFVKYSVLGTAGLLILMAIFLL